MAMAEATRRWQPAYTARVGAQRDFHADRYNVRLRGLLAGMGGGKTLAAATECIVVSQLHPGSKGLAAAPNYPQIERGLYEPFESQWLFGEPVENWEDVPIVDAWNQSKRKLRFANGSELWFVSLEKPSSIEAPNIDYWWMDEAQALRPGQFDDGYDALESRLRGDAYEGAWVTTHSPPEPLVTLFTEGKGQAPSSRLYRWTTHDAYQAGVISESYYQSMTSRFHGAEAEARLEGRYAKPEGLVFSMLDEETHVQQTPDEWTKATGGIDWGWNHNTTIIVALWTGEKVHLVEHFYDNHTEEGVVMREVEAADRHYGVDHWWAGHDEPETIQKLKRRGVRVEKRDIPAERGIRTILGKLKSHTLTVDADASGLLTEAGFLEWSDSDRKESIKPGTDDGWHGGSYAVSHEEAPREKQFRVS